VHLLGTADEDWHPCGCSAAHARKQVCSFMFHCHCQPLCGHHTAQKMKYVAFGKVLWWNNHLCTRFHLKQNVSSAVKIPLRFQPLVRATLYKVQVLGNDKLQMKISLGMKLTLLKCGKHLLPISSE